MCEPVKNPADRQFRRKCQVTAGAALLIYVACSQASQRMLDRRFSVVLAGIAGAAFFAELISVGLMVARLRDEFQRVLLMRSFLWATLGTMALTTVWGFMELHGRGQVPHLDVIWVPIILVCAIAAVKVFIFRQHRAVHE
jgi:sterol desaturase/sphingolipid hydroxylase (fatty acid hydroxylase superfamily)